MLKCGLRDLGKVSQHNSNCLQRLKSTSATDFKILQENDNSTFLLFLFHSHWSSILGHRIPEVPVPLFSVYPATKHALTALCQTVRQEIHFFKLNIKLTVSKLHHGTFWRANLWYINEHKNISIQLYICIYANKVDCKQLKII